MKIKLDKAQLREQAQLYGKRGAGFAFKAFVIYAIATLLGLVGGGISGWWGADHFDLASWLRWACTLLGIVAGGAVGFIAAQLIVMDMIQEMILDAGIEAGKAGYKAAKTKLAERQQAAENPQTPPDKLT
ncbi:MAG TPA: hypothetical protein VEF76_14770 [Patescibacteria group bacterium]|nr:hypothetical protein [Patescibacteria group bacterium]